MSKAVFGTREWASETANCVKGCSHGCWYCYAHANAVRHNQAHCHNWTSPTVYWESIARVERMSPTRVMFPSQHDITPDTLIPCLESISRLILAGHEVLIVSKPHRDCIRAICHMFESYREQIMFRFTIGSADSERLKFWEPFAPDLDERLWCLRWAFGHGFRTSVSSEPILDLTTRELIHLVVPYVSDAIWLGLPNWLPQRLGLNRAPDDVKRSGTQLLADLSDTYIGELYLEYSGYPKIKWKESIKKVVGIEVPVECGLDILNGGVSEYAEWSCEYLCDHHARVQQYVVGLHGVTQRESELHDRGGSTQSLRVGRKANQPSA